MAYILFNSSTPVSSLPKRLRLPNGLTRTNPTSLSDAELNSLGIRRVSNAPTNFDPVTEYVVWENYSVEVDENDNIISTTEEGWKIKTKPQEQIDAEQQQREELEAKALEQRWVNIRDQRDKLLKETDWAVTPDQTIVELTAQQKIDVDIYRQTLRDLPETYSNDIDSIVWPENPLNWDDRFFSFTNTGLPLSGETGLINTWKDNTTKLANNILVGVPTEDLTETSVNEGEPQFINATDSDGNPIQIVDIDEEGNSVPRVDIDGNPVYEQVENPNYTTTTTIATLPDELVNYRNAIIAERDRVISIIESATTANEIKTGVDETEWPEQPLNYNSTYFKNLYQQRTLAEIKVIVGKPVTDAAQKLLDATVSYDSLGNEAEVDQNIIDYRNEIEAERDRVLGIYNGKRSLSTLITALNDTVITWPTKP